MDGGGGNFNTSRVRLEEEFGAALEVDGADFNTSRVRLEVLSGKCRPPRGRSFQYLKGAIRGPPILAKNRR